MYLCCVELFTLPADWADYELLDSGDFRKLERFGAWVLDRPEPQAIWPRAWTEQRWQKEAHAKFTRTKGEEGEWKRKPGMPEQWWMAFLLDGHSLKFRLGLTAFKHVGIFPEQADNWAWIYQQVQAQGAGAKVLNLFAYTGGASMAARAAGADVIHLDAVKPVLSWARENMEASGQEGIRWLLEDAMKFVQREVKRGHTYHGIILDPPAYGRGPEGEKWVLEQQMSALMESVAALLDPQSHFLVLNLYSLGWSVLMAENLVRHFCPNAVTLQSGEIYAEDVSGRKMPLGMTVRFTTTGGTQP